MELLSAMFWSKATVDMRRSRYERGESILLTFGGIERTLLAGAGLHRVVAGRKWGELSSGQPLMLCKS